MEINLNLKIPQDEEDKCSVKDHLEIIEKDSKKEKFNKNNIRKLIF
jgi:hypothetical protein